MNKVQLALVPLLAAACAGAGAEQNVTIYGLLDSAIVIERGGPEGRATKLESGVSNGSRIGFRGDEDLGGGLSALFVLESGVLVDTGVSDQDGRLFGRQAFVGLRRHGVGTLTLGRQYTPIYKTLTTVDPFENNFGGAAGQLMAGAKAGTRQNNTVMFTSDKVNGLTAQLAYGFGEAAADASAARQMGGSVMVEAGKLTVRAAFNRTDNATATDRARNALLVAKYDFGPVVAGLGYGTSKGAGTTDSRDLIGALTFPFGPHAVMATYIRKDDRSATDAFDAHQYAATYTYKLGKRTLLYASWAKLSNMNFTTTKFGEGDREIDLGMKLVF